MGGVWKKIPFTWIMMIIGTLALTGFPFLSGFYSKDAIIEFAYLSPSTISNYVVFTGIFVAFLTAIYSWRLIFLTFYGEYKNSNPISKIHESPIIMLVPLVFLAIGAILAGYVSKEIFIGHYNSDFWKDSIFFLNKIEHQTIPIWLLSITPVIVIIAIPLSYYLYIKDKSFLEGIKKTNEPLYKFLLNKWYLDEIYEALFVKPILKIGLFFWKKGDENTIDRFGPNGLAKIIKNISNKAVQFQSGYIYDYAFVMLIGLSALITYLILT